MKGFTIIEKKECIVVMGGKDPSVAKLISVLGHIFGMFARWVRDLWGYNSTADQHRFYIAQN